MLIVAELHVAEQSTFEIMRQNTKLRQRLARSRHEHAKSAEGPAPLRERGNHARRRLNNAALGQSLQMTADIKRRYWFKNVKGL
jgi:hypothetical protein